jgi:hypothetical protein
MNRQQIRNQVQINRRDPGPIKHTTDEYNQAIDEAIDRMPESLWYLDVDTTLVTAAETRRYALTTLTGLSAAGQVQRLWLEGGDDHFYEVGRWQVEDDDGALTLILDEDPSDADLTIRLEYLRPHATFTADNVDFTGDASWLISMATVLLLVSADPQMEDPQQVQADVERWDAVRVAREKELMRQARPASRKARTQVW